jgi:hypothetical protein
MSRVRVTREDVADYPVPHLKSPDTTAGNVIAEGYAEHVGRGRYRLSEAGWLYLKNRK